MKQSKRPRRGLSRREFLTGTTAAGLAVGMPSLFLGCGDDEAQPARGPREARTLHFDLSFDEVSDVCLMALNSTSHRASLALHNAESRAMHRMRNPVLADVSDERLTHYIEDVDLPSDSFQLLWVTGTHAASAGPALLAMVSTCPLPCTWRRRARYWQAARRCVRWPRRSPTV